MSADSAPKRYHPVHVALHWLVAVLTILLLGVGALVFPRTPNSEELQLLGGHKIMGMALGVFMVIRVGTRFAFKRPAPVDAGHPALNLLAKIVHFLLYAGVFAIMAAGGALSKAYGLDDILKSGGVIPADLFVYSEMVMHSALAYLLIGLIALHVGAALYHQFIRKDNLLARMWFGK